MLAAGRGGVGGGAADKLAGYVGEPLIGWRVISAVPGLARTVWPQQSRLAPRS